MLELDGQSVKTLKRFGALIDAREEGAAIVFTVRSYGAEQSDGVESGGVTEKREVAPWVRL